MRLDFSEERVLAVVAHPDDAELLCVGTLGRARDDDAAVALFVLCQGEKGQPDPPLADLAAVRRAEMSAAAAFLSAQVYFGDVPDGTLSDGPSERQLLLEVFRRFRPTLVLAHWGQDYHPDHRAASALAEAATWFAASVGQRTAEEALPTPPALWWMDAVNRTGFDPEFYIDISGHMELKQRMLACHQSQLQRGSDRAFAPLQELMGQQAQARGAEAGVEAAEAFRAHHAWKRARGW